MNYEQIMSRLKFSGGEEEILSKIREKFKSESDVAWKRYLEGDESFRLYLEECSRESGFSAGMLNLYFYILFGEHTYEECKSHDISDDIFFGIMNVYPAVSVLNFKQANEYGFSLPVYRTFLRRYVGATIYFFERLEFEICPSPLDFEIEGRKVNKGDTVLSIHIPRSLPLTEELCEKSYALAKEFFAKHYKLENPVFICHSWLMDPWLEECLKPESAILNFRKKFKILEVDNDPDNVIGWVFEKKLDNIEDYPEDTSLRRATKKKLLAGERIGVAYGARL